LRQAGIVKSVLSGDTVILYNLADLKNGSGRIPEINFTLHGVKAPTLEKKSYGGGVGRDEKKRGEKEYEEGRCEGL